MKLVIGRRLILAAIRQAAVIRVIPELLGLSAQAPVMASARSPQDLSWDAPTE